MKKIYTFLLLSLVMVLGVQPVFAYNNANNNIEFFEQTEDFESFVLYNEDNQNNRRTFLFNNQESVLDEYYINAVEYQSSTAVYVQREKVHYDEQLYVAPDGYGFSEDGLLGLYSTDVFKEETYLQSKGYIRFTTKAYQIGFYDGGIVYHIEVDAEFVKSFLVQQKDNLVIQHGNNAVTYDGIEPKGELKQRLTIFNWDGTSSTSYPIQQLNPLYSAGSSGGVNYQFSIVASSDVNTGILMSNERVTGNHYLVAQDTTEVLPTYIHNYNWFINSLSVSFGPIGVGIDSGGGSDQMSGRTMTLPGYADRITSSVLKLQPDSFGFEPQYFFYEKVKNHTINGVNFETKRLRTGYIEEEYVNLSPYRSGAGTSYFEFNFEKPVHEFSVDLAFWSSNERYTIFDQAVLQYKDPNGQWVTLLDILDSNNNVPSNRYIPKTFTFYIIGGTNEIRFYSRVLNPSGSRNLGRISIGNMEFVSFEK